MSSTFLAPCLALLTLCSLLKTLFPLLSMTTSPNLRAFILKTILGDIKNANIKAKNHKLNRMVQGLLFGMIERGIDAEAERLGTGVKASRRGDVKIVGAREAMWAVKIAAELWRKNVWRDAKTVSIVASACFHPDTKVQSAAIHFFLITPDASKPDDEDSDNEAQEGPDIKTVKHRVEINKKKKSTERKAKKDIKSANVKRRQKEIAAKEPSVNFSALQLLNDPQTFGEKLYASLSKYDRSYTLDHKILIMSLFGRVCGSHKLTVLSFYSYIVKYLTHHQLQITAILVCLAQSVHDLTPPDELTPVIRKIAGEFVHSGVAAEVIAAGLNAIREICRRQPWCMDRDLLEDLVDYKMSKDKGVMVASRGLLQLYREVNPGLLKRRERGKVASMASKDVEPMAYGESREVANGIEGLDVRVPCSSSLSGADGRSYSRNICPRRPRRRKAKRTRTRNGKSGKSSPTRLILRVDGKTSPRTDRTLSSLTRRMRARATMRARRERLRRRDWRLWRTRPRSYCLTWSRGRWRWHPRRSKPSVSSGSRTTGRTRAPMRTRRRTWRTRSRSWRSWTSRSR